MRAEDDFAKHIADRESPRTLRGIQRAVSLAPMMDRTDRHFRYFLRCITRHTLLYTEMVTIGAILHGDRDRHLAFHEDEHPIALQIGGDDPAKLKECARLAEDYGYDEVNLNVGCPSDRVQQGRFGACLMAEPERVAEAVMIMRQAVDLPVTVKHRIGIDDLDRYEDMARFVEVVSQAGCDRFSVHARKAWLKGLSPKENREVPPLRYEDVYRLKRACPHLHIEINGGVKTTEEIARHLEHVDGVMIGRAAYDDPYLFATVDAAFFGDLAAPPTRREVIEAFLPYVRRELERGQPLHRMSRHVLGLFARQTGTRQWKRFLSENAYQKNAGSDVLLQALERVPQEIVDARPTVAELRPATHPA